MKDGAVAFIGKTISVCMATYNGEKYIKEQIESILSNLSEGDELIVFDDASCDSTVEIINSFADSRIKIIQGGRNKGFVAAFTKAIENAKGDYVFLSDQDDVWHTDKVSVMKKYFDKGADFVCHDARVINADGVELYESYFDWQGVKDSFLNIFLRPYLLGSCMAFTSNLRSLILPVPAHVKSHDRWITYVVLCCRKNREILNEKLIDYRRHGNNVSRCRRRNLLVAIFSRVKLFSILIYGLMKIYIRKILRYV